MRRLTIGVWYEDCGEPVLTQGTGKLLQSIIAGGASRGHQFVIACPSWKRTEVNQFIAGLDRLSGLSVSVLTARRAPAHFNRFGKRTISRVAPRRSSKLRLLHERLRGHLMRLVSRWSTAQLIFFGLLLFPVWIALACFIGAGICWEGVRSYLRQTQHPILARPRLHASRIKRFIGRRVAAALETLHNLAVEEEYRALAERATRDRRVGCWYVPHCLWDRAVLVRKPLVVAVPDFLPEEFPFTFVGSVHFATAYQKARKLLASAAIIISARQHVIEHHIIDGFELPRQKARLIPLAPVDLGGQFPARREEASARMAGDLIRAYCREAFLDDCPSFPYNFYWSYLPTFAFEDVRYVFLSTAFRPHKNILRVVAAIHELVHNRHFDVKLIMTAHLDESNLRFIHAHALQYDVISLPGVPSDVHSALYHLAAATVHPSLFEGDLPFQFSESLSVGTPVLLSRAPMVTEHLPPESHNYMLFDPYSVDDLADKIQAVCLSREEFLVKQRAILDRMKARRTWGNVADEYAEAFAAAASGGRLIQGQDSQDSCHSELVSLN
jgi:glycosyltransferase involved in cell wall biosynthesis